MGSRGWHSCTNVHWIWPWLNLIRALILMLGFKSAPEPYNGTGEDKCECIQPKRQNQLQTIHVITVRKPFGVYIACEQINIYGQRVTSDSCSTTNRLDLKRACVCGWEIMVSRKCYFCSLHFLFIYIHIYIFFLILSMASESVFFFFFGFDFVLSGACMCAMCIFQIVTLDLRHKSIAFCWCISILRIKMWKIEKKIPQIIEFIAHAFRVVDSCTIA